MPMNRYQIRNVYSLADPEVYKAADKDDPEALLEGVAMAGLVGVLRQLGDLAEFAAEIFHELHEEVLATASRGHGLLARVQQLDSEIPPIERAFLSQTSHSAFFTNSGVDWHPNRQATQNLITTGNLPRFVMDSYEECRGPPRLFLLDKFDVGGAGACLKRYTDPSIFKVETSSYETEIAETQREKKTRQMKKKGSNCKGGDTPEVSHAKLHQLFLEERVQTGAARLVKLKTRPKKVPFDSESGECYMNKLLNSPSCALTPSNELRLEDGGITGSAPMKNTTPRKVAESQTSYADVEGDDSHITDDDEIHTDGLQKGYPTDNYVDALANMEAEVETCVTQGTYSVANKHLLQSQLSIENSTASNDGNNSTTEGITVFGYSDTRSSLTESTSPDSPFASIEIPFHPRVDDTCIDTSKVDQLACLEQGSDHKKDAAECTSDVLPIDDSFSFVRDLNGDLENKNSSDTTFNDDVRVPEQQLKEKEDGVLVISDLAESDNSEIEPANTTDFSVIKEGTGTESEEREIESNLPVDVDKHEDDMHSLSEQDSAENKEVDVDQKHTVLPPVNIGPSVSNIQIIDSAHEAADSSESYTVIVSSEPPTSGHDIISDQDDSIALCHHESNVLTEADHDLESKSLNHGGNVQSSPIDNKVDQVNKQSSPVLPVKAEDAPPLPPLPPMQWRMRKLQTINLDTENEQVFWPSSSPYPFPPVLDEMQTNIRPMKVQRPRSPLIDAVAAHDKTKLRKVSARDTNQIPKVEERDTLLDQIRAKSINLKPAVRSRPINEGPHTNLRVVAILEKANAIRQAFAGSDDDDDSDNWSDS